MLAIIYNRIDSAWQSQSEKGIRDTSRVIPRIIPHIVLDYIQFEIPPNDKNVFIN